MTSSNTPDVSLCWVIHSIPSSQFGIFGDALQGDPKGFYSQAGQVWLALCLYACVCFRNFLSWTWKLDLCFKLKYTNLYRREWFTIIIKDNGFYIRPVKEEKSLYELEIIGRNLEFVLIPSNWHRIWVWTILGATKKSPFLIYFYQLLTHYWKTMHPEELSLLDHEWRSR